MRSPNRVIPLPYGSNLYSCRNIFWVTAINLPTNSFLPLVTDAVEGLRTTELAVVTAVTADTLVAERDCITEGNRKKNLLHGNFTKCISKVDTSHLHDICAW